MAETGVSAFPPSGPGEYPSTETPWLGREWSETHPDPNVDAGSRQGEIAGDRPDVAARGQGTPYYEDADTSTGRANERAVTGDYQGGQDFYDRSQGGLS